MAAKRIGWMVLVGALVLPQCAEASILDIIWRMSGPQLFGLGAECDVKLRSDPDPKEHGPEEQKGNETRKPTRPALDCNVLGIQFVRPPRQRPDDRDPRPSIAVRDQNPRRWRILEARAYFSTGRDADNGVPIKFSRVKMVGFDPMGAVAWGGKPPHHTLYSAAGVSLNRIFGPDFNSFGNWAIKIRPVAYDYKGNCVRIGFAYNLRWYPDGFSVEGPPASLSTKSAKELVQGFLFELRF